MSDCPYVLTIYNYPGQTVVYLKYDPCNCGRATYGCFAGIYWPDVLPWILLGAILASIGFLLILREKRRRRS